jgi:hypothetical protein
VEKRVGKLLCDAHVLRWAIGKIMAAGEASCTAKERFMLDEMSPWSEE